jgi:hypothetical protein
LAIAPRGDGAEDVDCAGVSGAVEPDAQAVSRAAEARAASRALGTAGRQGGIVTSGRRRDAHRSTTDADRVGVADRCKRMADVDVQGSGHCKHSIVTFDVVTNGAD